MRDSICWIRYCFAVVLLVQGWALPARAQFGPAQIAVAPVVQREISIGQVSVGTVMPRRKATIGSAVDGRVIEYPHNAGDRVEEGQPLAQLLTTTIKLDWSAAQAELVLRQQQLLELQNGTRPEDLAQAQARMLAAEATMINKRQRRARVEAMFANNRAVSEEERDLAVSEAIAAAQTYEELRQAFELAKAGPRKEQIAQAQAQVAMQQATVDRLADSIEKHTIRSRFTGYVTAEHTEIGQWLKAGDPVAEVVDLDEVEITTHLVEQFVPYTQVGMTVEVEVPALADRKMFTGVVASVVPQADVQARTFPVLVRVRNELVDGQPLLKAGMYARVSLPTGRKEQALLVAKDALVLGGPRPTVFVVASAVKGQPAKARPVPVELGAAVGGLIQVRGPLSAGEFVAVQGNERLNPPYDVVIQQVFDAEGAAEFRPPGGMQ